MSEPTPQGALRRYPHLPDAYNPATRDLEAEFKKRGKVPPPRIGRVTLALELKALRELAGLTQDELGRFLGTTQNTVNRLENGAMAIDARWRSHLTLAFACILGEK